jgi:hypothetical protein
MIRRAAPPKGVRRVQDALISVLEVTSDDVFQIIHELPRNRFLHTPSFLGLKWRLAMLKELNARIVAGAGTSPDDLMVHLSQDPGENYSFGQGLAQNAEWRLQD